jgi:hypothetical protein
MGLGEQLREARLRLNLTPSQVGAKTHMKVSFIEAIEREDFAKLPAPIYAKGFIRMYASHVGLDAAPLIAEYVERFAAQKTTARVPERIVRAEPIVEPVPATPVAPEEVPPADASPPEPGPAGSIEPAAAVPAPASATAPEADPDLFTELRRSGPERASLKAGLGLGPDERGETPVVAEVGATMRSFYEEAASVARQATSRVKVPRLPSPGQAWGRLKTAVREGFRMPSFRLTDLTPKHYLVLVGVLILLLFILSSASRCVRKATAATEPSAHSQRTALVALEPPDAYVD